MIWQEKFYWNTIVETTGEVYQEARPCFRFCLYHYEHPDIDAQILEEMTGKLQQRVIEHVSKVAVDKGKGARARKIKKDESDFFTSFHSKIPTGMNLCGYQLYDKEDERGCGCGPNKFIYFLVNPISYTQNKESVRSYTELCIDLKNFTTEELVNLLQVASSLDVASGCAGLGCSLEQNVEYTNQSFADNILAPARRFQLIDFMPSLKRSRTYKDWHTTGISGINWLTMIGDGFLDKIGGREKLKSKLSSEVKVHEFDKFIALQIGDEPIAGDINAGEDLSLYFHVGELLSPIAMRSHEIFKNLPELDEIKNWYDRFYTSD